MKCPDCGHDNLAGADQCEECGASLSQESLPHPKRGLQRAIMETPLRDLDPEPAITVPPGEPTANVVRLMRDRGQGSILVLDDGRLVGIFTERDIVNRLTGKTRDLDATPISEVMTRDPKALRDDHSVAFAMHRMAIGNYRHVPVVTEGQPPRFVTVRGVLKFLHERSR
jgi:CBS domain-containing protein